MPRQPKWISDDGDELELSSEGGCVMIEVNGMVFCASGEDSKDIADTIMKMVDDK